MPKKNLKYTDRYAWLDFVRGIAAIAVTAGHLRNALLVDYSQLTQKNYLLKVFYFLTGLGHQAVIIFFVLSGFFVGGSVLKKLENFSFNQYLTARITRLWVVLIPALFLTAIVDEIFRNYAPEILTGKLNNLSNSFPMAGAYSNSISTFFGNLFFLQNIYTPVFGINGPLWSLANEFWYYILFPLIFLAVGRLGNYEKIWLRLLGLIILGLIYVALPRDFIEGFLIWLMGAGVYAIAQTIQRAKRLKLLICSLGLVFLCLIYAKLDYYILPIILSKDILMGLGFSSFCLVTVTWTRPKKTLLQKIFNNISLGISEISYSLYLSHFPLIAIISVFIFKNGKLIPSMTSLLIYLFWLFVLLVFGILYWFMFEKNTKSIKKILIKIKI